MPLYVQIIFSFAGLVVAGSTAMVARLQLRLAKQKFQFDLFDRRLQAKDAIHGLGDAYINSTSHSKSEAWSRFYKIAYCSRFVFPDEAADWIKEVYKNFYQLWFVAELDWQREVNSPVRDDKRLAEHDQKLKQLQAFAGKLYQEADERLDRYLRITRVCGRSAI